MKRVRNEYVPVVIISVFPVFLYLNIVLSLYHDESRLESNRPTWPTSLGLLVSVLSYCLRSRWGQLPKYKYLSSRAQLIMLNQWLKLTMRWATQPREIRISVIRPAEKRIKKASSQVFELGETVLKKKRKTNPGVQLNGILAQMKGDMDIAVFRSILCLSHTDCLYTSTKNTPVDLWRRYQINFTL